MKENKLVNQIKDKAIWVVLIVLAIVFTAANPRFISPSNLLTLLRQVSMYGIASIGMTFVILLGDIDLSIGTIISFVNIICAHMMVNMGINPVVAVVISIAAATLIGTLNGFDDFDECMIYIAENYAWNANSDGAKFLMELLERKFA